MAISAPKISDAVQDYTKCYWVEAFGGLMDETVELPKDKVVFYARVLISHTLANNILKDRKLFDPTHQTQLAEAFYNDYMIDKGDKNKLLTTLFMKTLVDIDANLLKLSLDDTSYIENVALNGALKAKNFMHLKDDKNKKEWMLSYMYAKTPPKVIEYNVQLYRSMGVEAYNRLVEQELFVSAGANVVSKGATELFTEGWYTLYGKKVVSLADVVSLKEAMQDRNKVAQIKNPFMGLAFFEIDILRNTLPTDVRVLFWNCKISNLTTFIEQMSKTDQIAAQRNP